MVSTPVQVSCACGEGVEVGIAVVVSDGGVEVGTALVVSEGGDEVCCELTEEIAAGQLSLRLMSVYLESRLLLLNRGGLPCAL